MPWYPLPASGRDRKPQDGGGRLEINPYSPYAEGLGFEWVGGDRPFLDHTGNVTITQDLVATKQVPGRDGLVTRFADNTFDGFLLSHLAVNSKKPFTLAWRNRWVNETFNQFWLIETTTGEPLSLLYSTDSSYSDFWIASYDDVNWGWARSGTGFAPAGQWNNCVATYDPNIGGLGSIFNWRFFCNGIVRTAAAGGAAIPSPNVNRLGRTDGSGRDFQGDWEGARVYPDRRLADPLALEMSKRYWAPDGIPIAYRADAPRFWFISTEAPPKTVHTSLDSLLQKTGIASQVSLDAALLKKDAKKGVSLDSVLADLSSFGVDISFDGLLFKAGDFRLVTLDALLLAKGEMKTISLDGLLQQLGIPKSVSLDSVLVLEEGQSKFMSLDALLLAKGNGLAVALDAAIQSPGIKRGMSLDASLKNTLSSQGISFDALLRATIPLGVSLDALVVIPPTELRLSNVIGQ